MIFGHFGICLFLLSRTLLYSGNGTTAPSLLVRVIYWCYHLAVLGGHIGRLLTLRAREPWFNSRCNHVTFFYYTIQCQHSFFKDRNILKTSRFCSGSHSYNATFYVLDYVNEDDRWNYKLIVLNAKLISEKENDLACSNRDCF